MIADVVVDGLAAYRLARLVTMDDLTKPLRDRVWTYARDHEKEKLAEFIVCPHCVGVWCAAGVVLADILVSARRWRAPRRFLAAAGLASLAASVAGALDG